MGFLGISLFFDALDVMDRAVALLQTGDKAQRLFARLAREFPAEHVPCPAGSDRALDAAILTRPEARDPTLLEKLDAVAGRVLRAG